VGDVQVGAAEADERDAHLHLAGERRRELRPDDAHRRLA
jgi:hypothetical protein